MSSVDVAQLVEAVGPRWWHSIDLGDGIITPGTKPIETMRAEIEALKLPADLTGETVLDIGAWDGAFSFECERRGADVTALDHFIWSVDLDQMQGYLEQCAAAGEPPLSWELVPSVWKPDTLPGKAGFDAAHQALDSKVKVVVGDFMTMDLAPLGTFDYVLFLGVLYHMQEPLTSLQRLASLTAAGGTAIVETEMIAVPGAENYGVFEFIGFDDLGRDPTNWWVPNAVGLDQMLRASGFASVDIAPRPKALQPPQPRVHHRVEAAVKRPPAEPVPYPDIPPVRFRGVAHATKP
jgi:tRNA (mo5U34)-methyltransferase